MSPTKIVMIRHAEAHGEPGFAANGQKNEQSLTVRGWQRAGALVQFFHPRESNNLVPDHIFASAIGPESESRRPQETVAPLVDLIGPDDVGYCDTFMKSDATGLMREVMERSGTVLISWEHSRIPQNVAALPHAPQVPSEWPKDRYDLVWVLSRRGEEWVFEQTPQLLLAGDANV